ncbi:MAG: glycosyltransferase [Candidatus Shapirobacteria bacterium]
MKPLASVIIITKNQKDFLSKSLPVLKKQKLPGDLEIIIVDSGSPKSVINYYRQFNPKIISIKPKDFNFSHAFNLGASVAKGKYLIRLSGDVIPQKNDFIKQLISPFSDQKIGATYGNYQITDHIYDYPPFWSQKDFPQKSIRHHTEFRPLSGLIEKSLTDYKNIYKMAGGCCAIPAQIWQKRPFNQTLKFGEDAEYAWYLHSIGLDIVYVPTAATIHQHQKIDKLNYSFKFINTFFQLLPIISNNWLKIISNEPL